ncbi:hypothetical protein MK280_07235, partial [Myxococcota bacterium]|nr:hypothetical protein [Myxococcota bacterium]
ELFPPGYGTRAFFLISMMRGHHYLPIIGEGLSPDSGRSVQGRAHFSVPLSSIEEGVMHAKSAL